MDKKGSSLQIGGGIFVVLAFIILIFYILPQFSGANYEIQLESNKIIKNNDVKLLFKISNNLDEPLNNVLLKYEILNTSISTQSFSIGTLKSNEKYLNNINLLTRYLEKGTYVVKTTLIYDTSKEHKEIPLTLGIEIY